MSIKKLTSAKKMNKTTKKILIFIVIVLLIFGVIVAIYNNFKSEPINANVEKDNILDDANTGLSNLINYILDDNEESANNEEDAVTNNESNTQTTNTSNQSQSSNNNDDVTENQTTPGEQKAIELVKAEWEEEWGDLDGVSFNNVMIQGDGKYVVTVNDSKTTKVIRRYIVDTSTGLLEQKD